MTKRIIVLFTPNFYKLCKAACKVTTQMRREDKTLGGDRVCLEFLVLFVQAKRTAKKGEQSA